MKNRIQRISKVRSRFFHRNSVFRNTFFILLFLLLTLLMVFQLMLYRSAYRSMNNTLQESNQAYVETVAALSDEKLINLQSEVRDLMWDENILQSMVFPDKRTASRDFMILTAFKEFASARPYVSRIVMRCNADGSIYSSKGIIDSSEDPGINADFNASVLTKINVSDSHEISSSLIRTDSGEFIISYNLIRYSRGHLGTLLLYFDPAVFFSDTCADDKTISFYSNNTLLFSGSRNAPQVGHLQDNTSKIQSQIMDMTIYKPYEVKAYPLIQFLQSNYFFLFLPLMFILSLAAAWIFYKPLYKTLSSIPHNGRDRNSYDDWQFLNEAISNLHAESSHFSAVVDMMKPFVQARLLQELIDENIQDDSMISQTISSVDSSLPVTGDFVLYNTCNSTTGVLKSDERERILSNLDNLQVTGYTFYSFAYKYSVLTLMVANDASTPTAEGNLNGLAQSIAVYAHTSETISVTHSDLFHHLSELPAAYQQTILISNDSEDIQGDLAQLKSNIKEYITSLGDYSEDEACYTLSRFIAAITSSGYTLKDQQACLEFISENLAQYAKSYSLQTEIKTPDLTDPASYHDKVKEFSDDITNVIHLIFVNLDSRQRQYLVAAKNYIDSNYSDIDLTLSSTADHLGISPSYLSRLFSNAYEVRFTQYLNNIRVDHAKELLSDESKLIKDIAAEVGFGTTQNFLRVFKAKTGISPGEYRTAISKFINKD